MGTNSTEEAIPSVAADDSGNEGNDFGYSTDINIGAWLRSLDRLVKLAGEGVSEDPEKIQHAELVVALLGAIPVRQLAMFAFDAINALTNRDPKAGLIVSNRAKDYATSEMSKRILKQLAVAILNDELIEEDEEDEEI